MKTSHTQSFFTLLFIALTFNLAAQWYHLSNAQGGYPIANGKLVKAIHKHSGGGLGPDWVDIEATSNDGNTWSCVVCPILYKSGGGSVGFYGFRSYSDSVISMVGHYTGWNMHFTTNNFFALTSMAQYTANSNIIGAHFNTKKYNYALAQSSYFNDTLFFARTTVSSTVQTHIQLKKYKDGGKMLFLNDSIGYALAAYRSNPFKITLLKTVDYGTNWTETFVDSVSLIKDFDFPSPDIGYLTLKNTSVFKTVNGGANWSQLVSPSTMTANVIKFANDTLGYLGYDGGKLWRTVNGGTSWNQEATNCNTSIVRIFTFDTVAYFQEYSGEVFKRGLSPVGLKESAGNEALDLVVFPNPSNDILTIDLSDQMLTRVVITDLLGKTVRNFSVNKTAHRYEVSVSDLNAGLYILTIVTPDGSIQKRISIIH